MAICGPANSHITADALEHDPVLTFEPDHKAGLRYLLDRRTDERIYSPKDLGESDVEVAYIGRLPVEGGTMLVVAGIHSSGSVAAVDYLTHHLGDLFGEVGDRRFSMVVAGVLDGETGSEVEVVCAPRLHHQFES